MKKAVFMILISLMFCSVSTIAGTKFEVKMKVYNGEPVMINAPDPFINPRSNGIAGMKSLTIDRNNGILYGMDGSVDNNGRAATFLADTSILSVPSHPTNALFAYIPALNDTQCYSGAVSGGLKNRRAPQGSAIAFNPDFSNGVYVAQTYDGNILKLYHWALQDNSVGWGQHMHVKNLNSAALYADTYIDHGCCSRGTREGFAYLDHATVSGGTYSDVYRYFWYYTSDNNKANDVLRIVHISSTFQTSPTDTSVGRYYSEERKNSSGGSAYVLLNSAAIYSLVPTAVGSLFITGATVRKEVSPDVFDIFFLFNDDAGTRYSVSAPDTSEADDLTYLAAIRATIPSDGSAMSYEVIDLDPNNANTWVQLIDTVAGKDVVGTGIAFDADGKTMYCAGYLNYSTGNSSYDKGRIYLFNVDTPAPQGTLLLIK